MADGPEFSSEVTPVPNPDDMPVIRPRLDRYPTGAWTEHLHRGEMHVQIEMFVAGTDETDMMRLFHAVRSCLTPTTRAGTDATRNRLDPNSTIVQHAEITSAPGRAVPVGAGAYALRSVATYRLRIQVPAT